MRNPFIAAAMKAAVIANLARSAALACFNLGMRPRDQVEGGGATHVVRHSGRTVAQDKRDARKAHNRRRNKR